MSTGKRLTAADWTAAACAALAGGGLAAVAVEPLAALLGTTKGSFYWHFTGRDALIAAALEQWERNGTEDVITLVEAEPDPRDRLHALFRVAVGGHPGMPGGAGVELALQPSAGHPLVAPVLARVTRRRLGYLATLFADLGFDAEEARRRSLLGYTSYLGHAQLARATPDAVPSGPAIAGYVDAVVATLTRAR
ncbi:MAG: TetR/AcrR family transcriptional regulator [Pseudonocardia sp.]|nr:TetR/AcrR family transcriptional regulator [Pseudonocardia sp.]